MNRFKRLAITSAALLLFSSLAMFAPMSARADDSNTGTATEMRDGSKLAEQFKQQAQEKLKAQRQNVKQKTAAERQKSCTARKNSLTKRMNNVVAQAKRHKAVFDKIYTRVKDFHDTKQLNVPNYDTLVALTDGTQAAAQTSIDALQSLDVSVDCTSQNVADSVSAFQQAVKTTRDSLKAYRSVLVELVKATKGASTSPDNSSTNTTSQ